MAESRQGGPSVAIKSATGSDGVCRYSQTRNGPRGFAGLAHSRIFLSSALGRERRPSFDFRWANAVKLEIHFQRARVFSRRLLAMPRQSAISRRFHELS